MRSGRPLCAAGRAGDRGAGGARPLVDFGARGQQGRGRVVVWWRARYRPGLWLRSGRGRAGWWGTPRRPARAWTLCAAARANGAALAAPGPDGRGGFRRPRRSGPHRGARGGKQTAARGTAARCPRRSLALARAAAHRAGRPAPQRPGQPQWLALYTAPVLMVGGAFNAQRLEAAPCGRTADRVKAGVDRPHSTGMDTARRSGALHVAGRRALGQGPGERPARAGGNERRRRSAAAPGAHPAAPLPDGAAFAWPRGRGGEASVS
jgi:hypothetical protein